MLSGIQNEIECLFCYWTGTTCYPFNLSVARNAYSPLLSLCVSVRIQALLNEGGSGVQKVEVKQLLNNLFIF